MIFFVHNTLSPYAASILEVYDKIPKATDSDIPKATDSAKYFKDKEDNLITESVRVAVLVPNTIFSLGCINL